MEKRRRFKARWVVAKRLMLVGIMGSILSSAFNNCGQGFKSSDISTTSLDTSLGSDPSVQLKFDAATLDVMNASNAAIKYSQVSSENSYNLKCYLDSNALANCASPISLASATEGDHVVRIVAENSNGLVLAEISRVVRIDKQAPTLTVTAAPPSVTGATSVSIQFSSSDNLAQASEILNECALDSAGYSLCSNPVSYSNLSAGAHVIKLRATDRAGNASVVMSLNFTVSLGLPTVTLTQNPSAYINANSATFTFSGSSSNSTITGFECSIDNGANFAACSSPKVYSSLSDNTYNFSVRAKDALNQTSSPTKVQFIVDTTAPTMPSVSSNLSNPSKITTLNLSFSSSDASGIKSYQCSQDGAAYGACSTGQAFANLGSANHTFKVKATDQAGNVSAEGSYSILIDSVVPVLTITANPTNPTTDANSSFSFTSSDALSGIALIECQLDSAAFSTCSSPRVYANTSVGNRIFTVRATDKAGNSTVKTYAWTLNAVTTPPSPPTQTYPNMASANAKVELRVVHSAGDLYKRGCDLWKPNTEACRTASHQYCVSRGYAGGYGPIDVATTYSTVSCFGSQVADLKTYSYSGNCASGNGSSLSCQDLAQKSCVSAGYVGSSGVITSSASGISTMCLKSTLGNSANVNFGSITQLQQASSGTTCDLATATSGTGCVANAYKFCKTKGYGTGFLVNSYDSSAQSGSVFCAQAATVATELTFNSGYGTYSRGAVLGVDMVVGGPTSAGDTTHPDRIVNNFSYPIVLTYVAPTTTYVAPNGGNYSLDTSVFLNHGTYYPNNPSWDGEVISVYSSQPTVPTVNFGASKKGLLLMPGDTIGYQGAAKWGTGGTGLYNIGTVRFQAISEGYTGMLRRRFPSVDSSFNAGLVPAGCDASCSMQPTDSYVGFPKTASNFWYTAPSATTIGGMQIFTNSPIKAGRIRVVDANGNDIVTPYSFAMAGVTASWTNALVLGAGSFNAAFGAAQNGSSFLPLNIAVPAGARVGIEWNLQWGGDFGGFLYFNQ